MINTHYSKKVDNWTGKKEGYVYKHDPLNEKPKRLYNTVHNILNKLNQKYSKQ